MIILRTGTPANFCYSPASTVPVNSKNYLYLIPWHVSDAQCTDVIWCVMSALRPVFGQEESVPVLEEVNAPGLHRASPAKIHTSQVDLVRFCQNCNFHEASWLCMKFRNKTFSFAQAT